MYYEEQDARRPTLLTEAREHWCSVLHHSNLSFARMSFRWMRFPIPPAGPTKIPSKGSIGKRRIPWLFLATERYILRTCDCGSIGDLCYRSARTFKSRRTPFALPWSGCSVFLPLRKIWISNSNLVMRCAPSAFRRQAVGESKYTCDGVARHLASSRFPQTRS